MIPWIIELIPAILVIMLAVVFVAMGLWFLSSSKGEETPTGNTGGILLNSSLLFPTGHTDSEMATCIDSYIVKYAPSSYLVGHGADFVSAGKTNNVNPALLVAIAQAESSLGLTGIAHSGGYNYFGMTAVGGGNRRFGSVTEAINFQANYMRKSYLDKGLDTIEKIQQKYSPVGATNDPFGTNIEWTGNVTSAMKDLRKMCPSLIGQNELITSYISSPGGSFIAACQGGTGSGAQVQTASTMTPACAVANFALQTVLDVKNNECPEGTGCKGNSRKYVNSAKKSHYALTPLFRNGAVPRSWGDFADCGKFVSYVIRNSPGGDPNFPSSFVETQRDYVVRHSEKYDIFPNTWSNAQPGDILFGGSCNLSRNDPDPDHDGILGECSGRMTYYGHIQIYTGENNAFPGKIVVEASYGVKHPENMRGPMANGKYNKMNIIARLKATAPVSVK